MVDRISFVVVPWNSELVFANNIRRLRGGGRYLTKEVIDWLIKNVGPCYEQSEYLPFDGTTGWSVFTRVKANSFDIEDGIAFNDANHALIFKLTWGGK